jgi:hypothetical protein
VELIHVLKAASIADWVVLQGRDTGAGQVGVPNGVGAATPKVEVQVWVAQKLDTVQVTVTVPPVHDSGAVAELCVVE